MKPDIFRGCRSSDLSALILRDLRQYREIDLCCLNAEYIRGTVVFNKFGIELSVLQSINIKLNRKPGTCNVLFNSIALPFLSSDAPIRTSQIL